MLEKIDFAGLDLRDALDIALAIEEGAKERYREFSELTGGRYAGDAADVFRELAMDEESHAARLAERRKKLFGSSPRRVSGTILSEVEAPDFGKPRAFMSPRRALQVALEGEVQAYEFFAAALAQTKDPAARKLFEELRDEEKTHQELLKKRLATLPPGPDMEDADADEPPAL